MDFFYNRKNQKIIASVIAIIVAAAVLVTAIAGF